MDDDVKLTDQDIEVLNKLPSPLRGYAIAYWADIYSGFKGKLGFEIGLVDAFLSPFALLLVVDAPYRLSMPYLASCLRLVVGGWGIRVWDAVPGCNGTGIEIRHGSEVWKERLGLSSDVKVSESRLLLGNAWKAYVANRNSLPLAIGVDFKNEDFIIDLAELSVLTTTGGDRLALEVFYKCAVDSLRSVRKPNEVQFVLLDSGELTSIPSFQKLKKEYMFGDLSHEVSSDNDPRKWAQLTHRAVSGIKTEIEMRKRLFDALGCHCLKEYNAHSRQPLPRIVVVITGLSKITHDLLRKTEIFDAFHSLEELIWMENMREMGIHFWVHDFDLRTIKETVVLLQDDPNSRVGMLFWYGQLSAFDSLQYTLGREAAGATSPSFAVYRNYMNEVSRIRLTDEIIGV